MCLVCWSQSLGVSPRFRAACYTFSGMLVTTRCFRRDHTGRGGNTALYFLPYKKRGRKRRDFQAQRQRYQVYMMGPSTTSCLVSIKCLDYTAVANSCRCFEIARRWASKVHACRLCVRFFASQKARQETQRLTSTKVVQAKVLLPRGQMGGEKFKKHDACGHLGPSCFIQTTGSNTMNTPLSFLTSFGRDLLPAFDSPPASPSSGCDTWVPLWLWLGCVWD